MEKHIYLLVILFFGVCIPAVLYIILKPMHQQRKLTNGVVNYDAAMRKFIFKIFISKEDFYSKLKTPNIKDVLEYDFNEQISVITFKRYNAQFSYGIKIDEHKEFVILTVEQISISSRISYFINAFFIRKFNAEPIDYLK